MNRFYFLFFVSILAFRAEGQDYYSVENKNKVVTNYQDLIYRGCSAPKKTQDPIETKTMVNMVTGVKETLLEKFSKYFSDNPGRKSSLENDLEAIARDTSCQIKGNDCRARLMATAIFYFQHLRPDVPHCTPSKKKKSKDCEIEAKYRSEDLSSFSRDGLDDRAKYVDILLRELKQTTQKILDDVIYISKDSIAVHICDTPDSGAVYQYPFQTSLTSHSLKSDKIENSLAKKPLVIQDCQEDTVELLKEFIPSKFGAKRYTVGEDEISPIKKKIEDFRTSHPEFIVTDTSLLVSSSRTPSSISGKLDPNIDSKNIVVAKDRAKFAEKVLKEIDKIKVTVSFQLSGPPYTIKDANTRFLTSESYGYKDEVKKLFETNKNDYEKIALKKSADDLLNDSALLSLYQVKFKPFQGFLLTISGHKKGSLKCKDTLIQGTKSQEAKAIKQ